MQITSFCVSFQHNIWFGDSHVAISEGRMSTAVNSDRLMLGLLRLDWWHGTVVERRSWPANFPCRTLERQLMGDHLCG